MAFGQGNGSGLQDVPRLATSRPWNPHGGALIIRIGFFGLDNLRVQGRGLGGLM